ncbi:MAG: ABC transporter permease [Candidatus Limnocylindrales bacterium]
MTTVSATRATQRGAGGMRQALRDGLVLAWRYLKRVPRIPELAIFAIIQSIMFVLLFAFVFGGAIPLPGGGNYREFLMPGIFAQTIAFASATTAIGIADDMGKGIIDRFRSLPMARSAVLIGRTLSDVIYNAGILIILFVAGWAVGWTWHTGIAELLAGLGLLLLFTYAMSWIGVWLGLSVPNVEVGQQVAFTAIFPLTFVSSVFVPPATLPDFLRPVAEWNPVSTLASALRGLWGNPNPFVSASGLPSEQPALVTIMWVAIILAIFIPLAVRKYRSVNR